MGAFFSWIGSFVGGSFASVFTSISNSLLGWYKQASDTKVAEFTQGTTVDVEAYKAFLAYDQALTLARVASSNWWGVHLVFLLIAIPVAAHTGLVFVDSSVRFGCGHYGCLGVPDVPPDFRAIRAMVLAYVFGAGAIRTFSSIAAPLLKK